MLVFVASKIQAIQPEIYILVAHVWSKVHPVDDGSIIIVHGQNNKGITPEA